MKKTAGLCFLLLLAVSCGKKVVQTSPTTQRITAPQVRKVVPKLKDICDPTLSNYSSQHPNFCFAGIPNSDLTLVSDSLDVTVHGFVFSWVKLASLRVGREKLTLGEPDSTGNWYRYEIRYNCRLTQGKKKVLNFVVRDWRAHTNRYVIKLYPATRQLTQLIFVPRPPEQSGMLPNDTIRQTTENVLNQMADPGDDLLIYASFEARPLASGSIGLVSMDERWTMTSLIDHVNRLRNYRKGLVLNLLVPAGKEQLIRTTFNRINNPLELLSLHITTSREDWRRLFKVKPVSTIPAVRKICERQGLLCRSNSITYHKPETATPEEPMFVKTLFEEPNMTKGSKQLAIVDRKENRIYLLKKKSFWKKVGKVAGAALAVGAMAYMANQSKQSARNPYGKQKSFNTNNGKLNYRGNPGPALALLAGVATYAVVDSIRYNVKRAYAKKGKVWVNQDKKGPNYSSLREALGDSERWKKNGYDLSKLNDKYSQLVIYETN